MNKLSKKNKIFYSQCWEDVNLVAKGLDLSVDDNLVIITSGGDNVLNLSLFQTKEIVAIDFNPRQNFLLELKIVAIKYLEYDDCISFLGLVDDKSRYEKYNNIKKYLSHQAVSFWDENTKYIKKGVIHCGQFESFVEVFRKFLLIFIHNKKDIDRLLSFENINRQKEYYYKEWRNKRWEYIFKIFFDKSIFSKFGRSKRMFKYCQTEKTGKYYLERLDQFFSTKLVRDNYYIRYLFTGRYYSSFYPGYLNENNFSKLKSSVDCIRIVNNDIMKYIDELDKNKKYKFCFSDIFESMTQVETDLFFKNLIKKCYSGSRICFWNNLVNRYPIHPELIYFKDYSEELFSQDKLFFYSKFFVYERK